MWALGLAGAFGSLPVIARVRRLVIWADNDAGGTGMREARKCAERWVESGRAVVIRCPAKSAPTMPILLNGDQGRLHKCSRK